MNKALLLLLTYNGYLEEKHCAIMEVVNWINGFSRATPMLTERISDREIMIIKTWVFAQRFLENEQSEPVPSRKTTDIFIDKILPFKQKFKFWKTCICHCQILYT